MDVIELRGLRCLALCGVLPEERTRVQPLEADIDVALDLREAGRSDGLDATIDYGSVLASAERVLTTTQASLLEHLAELVADEVLLDRRVASVTVALRKLRPPVPQHVDTAGVRITRTQDTGR